jgi:Spy/CpxP family protein refolding chaperone
MSTSWTRRAFWMGGGTLAAAASAFALSPRAFAFHGGGFGGHHGRGFSHILANPEQAKERAGVATEWLLKTVDGTEEQTQAARRITDRLVDELRPFAERRREVHEAVARELAKPSVDREALERLRQDGIKLADDASRVAVAALGDFADVLKPEQRQELLEWAKRMHGN